MSSLGKNFRITIFGASHGEAIGVIMEGLPVGFAIDMDALNAFLTRRAPGRGAFATARRESDAPLFLSGVKNGVTCGGAVTAVIRNGDAHPGDYDALRNTPRPGHADFAARMKDGDAVDLSGGGRFSGRLTAPLCVAGGCSACRTSFTFQASTRCSTPSKRASAATVCCPSKTAPRVR